MKSRILLLTSTLFIALALMAQSTSTNAPAPADNAKACACCNHDQAGSKTMACCGKDAKCCASGGDCCKGKDGKSCPMMSKDSGGKMSCCADGKCGMMSKKEGKGCCGGKMCARPQTGA